MQEFSHLSDADLLVLSSRVQAEIQRRRNEKTEAEDKKWADRLARFPEAQIGCQTKIVWVSTVIDSVKFECKVTHPPFICYLNMERDGDGSSKFFEFRVELHPGRSDKWYCYRSSSGLEGNMFPYDHSKGRCERHLPPEVLSLPWIAMIIQEPNRVWNLLLSDEESPTKKRATQI